MRRTFLSRRRPRPSHRSTVAASARPSVANRSQDFRTQLRRLFPQPYRVDGDPVSSQEESIAEGLPPDLLAVLRNPAIIVPQDAAVFELIASWANAPSDTASASPAPPAVTHTGQ